MPNKMAVRKMISRVRRRSLLQEPKTLIDVNIPEELRKIISEDVSLLKETVIDDDMILVFSTRFNTCRLVQSNLWIDHDTFKTVLDIFLELYTIGHSCWPLAALVLHLIQRSFSTAHQNKVT